MTADRDPAMRARSASPSHAACLPEGRSEAAVDVTHSRPLGSRDSEGRAHVHRVLIRESAENTRTQARAHERGVLLASTPGVTTVGSRNRHRRRPMKVQRLSLLAVASALLIAVPTALGHPDHPDSGNIEM